MSFAEYLQLLDWTGRQVREDKTGVIPGGLAPILDRLQVSHENWLVLKRPMTAARPAHLHRCKRKPRSAAAATCMASCIVELSSTRRRDRVREREIVNFSGNPTLPNVPSGHWLRALMLKRA